MLRGWPKGKTWLSTSQATALYSHRSCLFFQLFPFGRFIVQTVHCQGNCISEGLCEILARQRAEIKDIGREWRQVSKWKSALRREENLILPPVTAHFRSIPGAWRVFLGPAFPHRSGAEVRGKVRDKQTLLRVPSFRVVKRHPGRQEVADSDSRARPGQRCRRRNGYSLCD